MPFHHEELLPLRLKSRGILLVRIKSMFVGLCEAWHLYSSYVRVRACVCVCVCAYFCVLRHPCVCVPGSLKACPHVYHPFPAAVSCKLALCCLVAIPVKLMAGTGQSYDVFVSYTPPPQFQSAPGGCLPDVLSGFFIFLLLPDMDVRGFQQHARVSRRLSLSPSVLTRCLFVA